MIKVDEKVNEKSGNKRRNQIALENQWKKRAKQMKKRKSNQWENLLIQRLLLQRGMNMKKIFYSIITSSHSAIKNFD